LATPPEIPWNWRQVATPKEVTSAAFAQLVLENRLEVVRSGGYMYAANRTDDGYDLYRTFDSWDAIPVSTGATADPAAGASPVAVTVSAGERWLLLGGICLATVSADVLTRNVQITVLGDGTNESFNGGKAYFVASETCRGAFGAGVAYNDQSGLGFIHLTLPGAGIEIAAGGSFQLLYVLHANDNCGPMYYTYKKASA